MHIIHIHVYIHHSELGRASLSMGMVAMVKSLRKHSICLMIASERLTNIPLKDLIIYQGVIYYYYIINEC